MLTAAQKGTAGLCACLVVAPVAAQAQQESATALAKQTQNPVASLISVPVQANWDSGVGDRQTTGTLVNVQPVLPFRLTKDWNVILRVVMPLASQPTAAGPRVNGIGDTVATAFLSPARTGRLIVGAGPVFLLPTATSNALGSEKIGLAAGDVILRINGRPLEDADALRRSILDLRGRERAILVVQRGPGRYHVAIPLT